MKQWLYRSRTMVPMLAVALCLSVVQADADEQAPARISVSAEGHAELVPDMAILTLTVTREAKTARAALDANSEAMSEVINAMQAAGIAPRDLQSTNFAIQPRYTQPPRSAGTERPPARIDGYRVRNSLTVRVREISQVGAILDQSVTLGVNEGGSIQLTNDDPSAAIEKARIEAVKQAMVKARTLAAAAGVSLGRVLEISEHTRTPRAMPMRNVQMSMARAADAVPVAVGENTYQVTVNLMMAIKQ